MWSMITSALGMIASPVTQWIKNKGELNMAEHKRKLTVITGEQSWDQIQASNSSGSWKDEFLCVFFSIPFMIPFYAAIVGDDALILRVDTAFNILDTRVPAEYWYIMSAIVAASFGIKSVVNGVQALRGK